MSKKGQKRLRTAKHPVLKDEKSPDYQEEIVDEELQNIVNDEATMEIDENIFLNTFQNDVKEEISNNQKQEYSFIPITDAEMDKDQIDRKEFEDWILRNNLNTKISGKGQNELIIEYQLAHKQAEQGNKIENGETLEDRRVKSRQQYLNFRLDKKLFERIAEINLREDLTDQQKEQAIEDVRKAEQLRSGVEDQDQYSIPSLKNELEDETNIKGKQ
ncbi:MAG: hypothetical protein EZS28_027584, partial [Streblomastix strix]